MKNNEQKQHFRSFGVISVFSLLGLCILALYPVMTSQTGENGHKALHRAEGLAYQLVEIHKNLNIQQPYRSIASEASESHLGAPEGQIGMDPWGHAYQFKVLRSSTGKKAKVAVWSLGENGQSESQREAFLGDDIGVLVDIR